MELPLDADEWAALNPEERIRYCRLMAKRARATAPTAASPELKAAYFKIAQNWEELADEIERHS